MASLKQDATKDAPKKEHAASAASLAPLQTQGCGSKVRGCPGEHRTSGNLQDWAHRGRLRILTVGDGDLTLSLALSRAYGSDQVDLTATTLCASYEELCDTYSNTAAVVQELVEERHVSVLYGIDATQLSSSLLLATTNTTPGQHRQQAFDLVLFHHPHLGLMTSKNSTDEQCHAQRHFVLLAHYLASAKSLLLLSDDTENDDNHEHPNSSYYDGRIHLCLAHDQPHTWQMEQAAQMQGLALVHTANTCTPFHTILRQLHLSRRGLAGKGDTTNGQKKDKQQQEQPTTDESKTITITPRPPEPGQAAPPRYRNGKLGSKHWLGRYGYQHRRTHGKKFDGGACDMNVEGSKHYFFAVQSSRIKADHDKNDEDTNKDKDRNI